MHYRHTQIQAQRVYQRLLGRTAVACDDGRTNMIEAHTMAHTLADKPIKQAVFGQNAVP